MEKFEETSIWKRIVNFIKRIFGKNDVLLINSQKEEKNIPGNNTIEEVLKEYKILELQRKYEKGRIKEEELSDYEKDSLEALYKKQIETLKTNIAIKKKEILGYKEQIIEAKQAFLTKFGKNSKKC